MRRMLAMIAATGLALPVAAQAGLEVCNDTDLRQSVAIGYEAPGGVWTSEGWWEVLAGECTTVLGGDLPLTHYYWRATTGDEDFPAEDYYFCSSDDVFTIVGDTNCEVRGYTREPFSEIVVGSAAG